MKSWLVALRIARREVRRAKGRTLLVVAMIAMPVLALSFAVTAYDSMRVSPAEQRVREIGAATGTLNFAPPNGSSNATPPTAASLAGKLSAGVRATPYFSDYVAMKTATGVGTLSAYGYDTTDPMTKGIVRTVEGRTPVTDDEVAVSGPALTRLGVHIGDIVSVYPRQDDPSFPLHNYRVVGVVEVGGKIEEGVLFRPSQMPANTNWLYSSDAPLTPAQTAALRALNLEPAGIGPVAHPTDVARAFNVFGIGTIITGLGILEVVLLAGPAFAVGAKRRQRDLALAAANGAPPSMIRRIVLGDGVVAGLIAAIGGIMIGVVGAGVSQDFVAEHLTHERGGGFQMSPLALLLIAVIAVVTGVLGAMVPAYTVGRQDVIEALSGRRGITKSRALWMIIGVTGVAVAGAVAYLGAQRHSSNLVLAGLITGELGLVLCTPRLVGLVARLGKILPLAPRIALRDTARRRAAAAPAISAVMAAVAGSVALTVYLGASNARFSDYMQGRPTGSVTVETKQATPGDNGTAERVHQTIIDTLQKTLPGAAVGDAYMFDCKCNLRPVLPVNLACPFTADAPLSVADQRRARADKRCADPFNNSLDGWAVAKGSDAAAALGLTGPSLATASAALDRGDAIVTDPRFVDGSGHVTVAIDAYSDDGTTAAPRSVRLAAVAVNAPGLRTILYPTAAASTLGVKFWRFAVVANPPSPLTQSQTDRLNAGLLTAGLDQAYIESGPPKHDNSITLILALAAGLIALGAAAIATGLAAADSRADLVTLGAVGASPRVRRTLSLAQSGVIAFLGSALGVIAGFGAAAAILTGLNRVWSSGWPAPPPYPIQVPWLNLLVSLLVVPAVAMLGAGLLTKSRLPSERRAD